MRFLPLPFFLADALLWRRSSKAFSPFLQGFFEKVPSLFAKSAEGFVSRAALLD
jgi:hypothetical protein